MGALRLSATRNTGCAALAHTYTLYGYDILSKLNSRIKHFESKQFMAHLYDLLANKYEYTDIWMNRYRMILVESLYITCTRA